MISSKKELEFYIKADRIMNTGTDKAERRLLYRNHLLLLLKYLRKSEYYNSHNPILFNFWYMKYLRLSERLGITINLGVFGYGLVIPHYGTIVVGGGNRIGNYCVLHTSTCITAGRKVIGDAFYLSSGAKVVNNINVAEGVTLAANAVLNSSVEDPDVLLVGTPARVKKKTTKWFERDGEKYIERVKKCEELRKKYRLD